jgi:hypothetical protein
MIQGNNMLQLIANDNVIEVLGEGRTQKTLRFQAHSGDRIIIQDAYEKHMQINIKTKKIDNDLYIFEDGVNIPSIIIKDYFAVDEVNIYAYNANGELAQCVYAQINNVDGLLNLTAIERTGLSIEQLSLSGLALGVVGAMAGGGGGGNNADTTAPNSPILSISDDDNDGMPTASGTAEANSIITITWSDGTKSSTTADSNGKYSIEASKVQLSGDISATATDASGNESASTLVSYIDTQAPQAPTLSIEDTDGNGKPNAHGTAEPGSTVTITWPDKTISTVIADSSGNYSAESPNVQPTGDVSVVATDTNSNMGASSTEIIYTDNQPPTATITIEDTQLIINETSTVIITFSEAVKDFSKEDVTTENGTLGDFVTTDNITWTATFTPNVDIEDNTNVITLADTYTDVSNNAGTITTSNNYEIDTLSNIFVWESTDKGVPGTPETDTLDNFDIEGAVDVLNIDDLLQGEEGDGNDIGNLLNYIHIEAGIDSTIQISSSGGFTSGIYDFSVEDKTIILNNVNLSSFGIDDEQIIKAMISSGILVT